jgi:hypothetical protein
MVSEIIFAFITPITYFANCTSKKMHRSCTELEAKREKNSIRQLLVRLEQSIESTNKEISFSIH